MAFKKLDSAAVDSTLSRPVDAFVAQGIDANVRAAWTSRGRGAGKSYGADKRPTLASANVSCVPLSPWYVSPTCTEITCKLRGLATSDGAGGIALNARLVAQTLGGIIYDDLDNATILDDASVQEKELTLDVAALEGEETTEDATDAGDAAVKKEERQSGDPKQETAYQSRNRCKFSHGDTPNVDG